MNTNIALLIIDVQNALFSIPNVPIYEAEKLISNIKQVIDKAREKEIPIIYIQHFQGEGGLLEKGTEGWEIHPEIAPLDGDIIVNKHAPDSFYNTTLQEELKKRNIEKLVIAGLQTEYCIDTSVRSSFSKGYKVILVKDGHSTLDSPIMKASKTVEHHNFVLGNWFAELKMSNEITF